MARFVTINNKRINAEKIQCFQTTPTGVCIHYCDGSQDNVGQINMPTFERLMGRHHITQVIPCHIPLWLVWQNANEYSAERVHFLALCANGELRPLTPQGNWMWNDGEYNPEGLYCENELDQFEDLIFYDPCRG